MAKAKTATKSRKTASSSSSASSGSVRKIATLIKGIRTAMLTTTLKNGTLRSRPMAQQPGGFDGELWFFTYDHTAKTDEITKDKHVNVAFVDPGYNRYVSLSGLASVVKDRAKAAELWNPMAKAWFPKGLDDPKLVLLRVQVTQGEYWDGPSSTIVQLYSYAKALVTGRTPTNQGVNRKISLRGPGRGARRTARAARRKGD